MQRCGLDPVQPAAYPRTMTKDIQIFDGLSRVADHYDAMLCDAWGVIHNGVTLFPGVADAMSTFRKERGPVIILTNAPRPSSIIPAQLDRLGLPRSAYDAVVTSGDATRAEIIARLPGKAYRIGPEKDDPLFEGIHIDFTGLDHADFIICTGLVDDQNETPEDYRHLLAAAASRQLTMICANPDIIVNWGGRKVWCAGALAEIYKMLEGPVVYGGKPHPPIYDLARAAVHELAIARARILAIGDGPATDILGANQNGIDAIFVAGQGGIHDGDVTAGAIAQSLSNAGAHAIGALEGLTW